MGHYLRLGLELRRKLGHADVRLCLHPADQHRNVRRKLARSRRATLPRRSCRTRLRYTRHKLDRAAHAHPKPPRRITTRLSGRNMVRYPLTTIARKSLPNDRSDERRGGQKEVSTCYYWGATHT